MKQISTLALLMLLLLRAQAYAAELVFFDENNFDAHPRGFYNFDTDTHAVSFRTPVSGDERIFAIDRRASDGQVFGIDLAGGLWKLDIDTGAKTEIGSSGVAEEMVGLAIDPLTGDIYASADNGGGIDLYRLDSTTAAATLIGSNNVRRGLAFSPSGVLYGFDYDLLFTIDPGTAATHRDPGPIGPLSVEMGDGAFTADGRYFIDDHLGHIAEVDPSTGGGLDSAYIHSNGIRGLIAVPEPSSLCLLLLGALCAKTFCSIAGSNRRPRAEQN